MESKHWTAGVTDATPELAARLVKAALRGSYTVSATPSGREDWAVYLTGPEPFDLIACCYAQLRQEQAQRRAPEAAQDDA